ncbi:MAG TPA: DUF1987 domain-containing protein [Salinivirga sp.]|uniref:DUF1987 domain-containing protein n=1 Tax=Salinivirga sp. TaxID=1970192 RepID=UPI002B4A8905|nr:DUF1987 domain-containing protein [Salinivirga sp.]HKK58410.1 DUF1987 domain-containing protein [Salinivirga sp.]
MEDLFYEATHSTPGIALNGSTGTIELYGRSIPENAINTYKPVLDWLDEYSVQPKETTTLNFKIEFFNTSSSKFILQILKKLEELHKQKFEVKVNWYYNDDDILDLAQDYNELVKIPFAFHEAVLK